MYKNFDILIGSKASDDLLWILIGSKTSDDLLWILIQSSNSDDLWILIGSSNSDDFCGFVLGQIKAELMRSSRASYLVK